MGIEFDPGRRKFFKLAGAAAIGLLLKSSGEAVEKEPRFCLPLEGRVTQYFWEGHKAIDIDGEEATPILTAADGIVSMAIVPPEITEKSSRGYVTIFQFDEERKVGEWRLHVVDINNCLGYYVVINHNGGFETLYGHLRGLTVKEGDRVFAGEKIGEVGMTGCTNGPHLHFEMRKNGEAINPLLFLKLNCER